MYAVVKTKFMATKMKAGEDQLYKVAIIKSSPTKLTDGGRAILNSRIESHHRPASGEISKAPRRRIIVRLLVRSYIVFARQNKAEDVSP